MLYENDTERLGRQESGSDVSILKALSLKDGDWNVEILKLLIENIPVIICAYHGTRYIYANSTFQKIMGYSLEEVMERNFWDFVHPDHQEMVKARGLARLRGETVPTNYEFKCLKKNGEERWFNLFFALADLGGQNISISAAIDITDSKRLKEELQSARDDLERRVIKRTEELHKRNQELDFLNQGLNNILQNMTDGVVAVDRFGDFEILKPFFSPVDDKMIAEVKEELKKLFKRKENDFLRRMVNKKELFREEEIRLTTSRGPLLFFASGTPILGEEGIFNRGVIMLRPIKDVHTLVNRISGARAVFHFSDIITGAPIIQDLVRNLKTYAGGMSTVLISGESGTGKELIAQAIHNESPRCKGPFLAVNCGAIPRELIGSELFGYTEGAFTGAKKGGNPGKFELANGGTLFLDEIGDMPLEQQATLLRVLQEKRVMRIGGRREIPVDVRVVCATNADLYMKIRKGSFREDLYYRLNVISVNIPPLRERKEDVILLFNHYLKMNASKFNKKIEHVNPDVVRRLQQYDWPGNVRELQNVVERILYGLQGNAIEVDHLPIEIRAGASAGISPALSKMPEGHVSLTLHEARTLSRQLMIDAERSKITCLLGKYGGNVSQVAKEMGIARSTIYKKMRSQKVEIE